MINTIIYKLKLNRLSTLKVFALIFGLSINAQTDANGNKDYSDIPVSNSGPNIIYIYLDDLGYGDLGNFWQNQRSDDKKMLTPNIDNFANEGAMLTHHYTAAPVCAPARASLLEGLHQGHSDVRNNSFDKAMVDGLTMAQLLSKAGYRTLHIGKAGLAGSKSTPEPVDLPAHPLKRGFDQFYGYLYHRQGHHHYPVNGTTIKNAYFTDGYTKILTGTELTYTTDVFTAKSKQWITTHEATRPEQPFFLYLAYDVPHSILQVPTQAYPTGGGLTGGLQWTGENSPIPWVNTASGTADSFIHPDYATKSWTLNEKKHATMIRRVDSAVKDLIKLLQDLNIDDETLIVFSSDNGPHHENGGDPKSFQSYGNLNGVKRDMWEGGIKEPTICRYPGVIPANSEMTLPSGQWDWLATFADLANVPVPAYTDGVSLMPALKQDNANQVDRGYTYHEYNFNGSTPSYPDFESSKQGRIRKQMQVVRIGDYKGVRYNITNHTDDFEIYNVVTDERESINLAPSMSNLQQQMKDKVLQVRRKHANYSRPYDDVLIPGVSVENFVKGLEKRVYQGAYNWVPDFEYLTAASTTTSIGIDASSQGTVSNTGYYYKGFINIPTDGTYTFYLTAASNCHVMLHDIHVLDDDFHYSGSEQATTLNLKAGLHPIRIFYQQNTSLVPSIDLKMEGPGMTKATIPDAMYVYEVIRRKY
ncbi:sulfatase-like hydrolase/transferase [Bacteroidota bacterium]